MEMPYSPILGNIASRDLDAACDFISNLIAILPFFPQCPEYPPCLRLVFLSLLPRYRSGLSSLHLAVADNGIRCKHSD